MKFLNLTPHAVGIRRADGSVTLIDPSSPPARIAMAAGPQVELVDGIPIHGPSTYIDLINLPDWEEGTILIVSQLTALAVAATDPTRSDVVYPSTMREDGAVRDAFGVLTVARLIRAVE